MTQSVKDKEQKMDIAFQEYLDGNAVKWMEKVTDKQYNDK